MKIDKDNTTYWKGVYNGVNFEIENKPSVIHHISSNWSYYLIINLERIPQKYDPDSFWLNGKKIFGTISYNYFGNKILEDLNWKICIGHYSKIKGFDGEDRIIKIGCDYIEYSDNENRYDIEQAINDVKSSIDKFISHIPDYKYRCCGNGKLYNRNEGVIVEENFHSKECFGETEWFKKRI